MCYLQNPGLLIFLLLTMVVDLLEQRLLVLDGNFDSSFPSDGFSTLILYYDCIMILFEVCLYYQAYSRHFNVFWLKINTMCISIEA